MKSLTEFKEGVDGWIKEINAKIGDIENTPLWEEISNNNRDIDHNYELIQQIKTEIRAMINELISIKTLQKGILAEALTQIQKIKKKE